jgi:hypothetical protein
MRKLPLPKGPEEFELDEIDGQKFIQSPSNGTASVMRHDVPLLGAEAELARNAIPQKSASLRIPALRKRFPALDFYCSDGDIKLFLDSPRRGMSFAIETMSKLTGLSEKTVARYSRQRTRPKRLAKR